MPAQNAFQPMSVVNVEIQRRSKTLNQGHRTGASGGFCIPGLMNQMCRQCAVDAAKRNQVFGMTAFTLYPQETVFQTAALQVVRKLLTHVIRYLERDVRQLINVQDLDAFQRFLRMCAARTGQLLNLSSLANDCGITHNTAKDWISVLEASYIVHLLAPHHQNFNKRLVKTPKLYFLDTGLAVWLLGIQTVDQLSIHSQRGTLFESWVIGELLKSRYNAGEVSNLYFWRDRSGHEVDVLIDHGIRLSPLEIKSGQTISRDSFKGLDFWKKLAGETTGQPWLVYGGDRGL